MCGGVLQLSAIADAKRHRRSKERCSDNGSAGCVTRGERGPPIGRICPESASNLQDRYEVSVISESKAGILDAQGRSFVPGDPNDPARDRWLEDETGLYSTNGGALAMMRRLEPTGNAVRTSRPVYLRRPRRIPWLLLGLVGGAAAPD